RNCVEVLLPTTKHRRGRRTARQEAALASASPYLLTDGADLAALFDGWPVVLDMGFGTGEAVIAYAEPSDARADAWSWAGGPPRNSSFSFAHWSGIGQTDCLVCPHD
ncbi:MAG: hypothetical protein ACKOMX_00285, partial [Actinomycetota bacterium]